MNKILARLTYNFAQLLFLVSGQKICILEWGRGTGKSTILAKFIIDCVLQMPRSSGVMVAATYQQILTRTLPSTIASLEQHGFYNGIHFFVGRRPPKKWKWILPYEAPLDYKRCIIFYNGTILNFVGQDSSGTSGRGMNTDWIVGDEAALLNEEKFQTDVLLTNRGNAKRIAHYPDGTWKYFKDCPNHHAITLATSTPVTTKGMWILKYEEKAVLNPDKYRFIRASAEVNRHNLGDEYFENARAIMPDFLYEAEVENKRIKTIEDGFYPRLNEDVHSYNNFNYDYYEQLNDISSVTCGGDKDLDPSKGLIVGIDWGKNINCMVVTQATTEQHTILKNHYVLSGKIIDDLMNDEFIPYYKPHKTKTIQMFYDPTGNIEVANSRKTYAEQAKSILVKEGWHVELMTTGVHNIAHETKYVLMIGILKEDDIKYPIVRFNKTNCKELWISMSNAPAKIGRNESIKKDKSSEKRKGMDQSHATHLSDAFDVIMCGMYLDRMRRRYTPIPDSFM